MNVFIDNKSRVPIYEQIHQQVKAQIISGQLKEDDPLPSVRNLAKDLRISVITTRRAYEELKKDGFVYTIAAKSFFVAAKNTEKIREEYLTEIEMHFHKIMELAENCHLSYEEVLEILNTLWRNQS